MKILLGISGMNNEIESRGSLLSSFEDERFIFPERRDGN